MRRTPDEVYAALLAAGWPAQLAVVMTAIAGAESGWRDDAQGDLGLQNNTWGPSFGLFQIRTLRADTGTGSDRDINRLAGSPTEQAEAALAIYQRAGGFSPWTVYRTGAYRQHLDAAQAAAARAGTPVASVAGGDGDGPFPTLGPDWLPWNWPSVAANKTVTGALTGARTIALQGLAALAGAALVVGGLWWLARRRGGGS